MIFTSICMDCDKVKPEGAGERDAWGPRVVPAAEQRAQHKERFSHGLCWPCFVQRMGKEKAELIASRRAVAVCS